MKREVSGRVEELFLTAADLTAEDRVEFLFRQCGNDRDMLREVRRRLELENNHSPISNKNQTGDLSLKSDKTPTEILTDQSSIPPGTQIKRYRIISMIGKGGMGDVYLADDLSLERKVALKVLNKELAEDRERLHRFIQEAKAASALNHPNIITVHEIDSFEGLKYIVSEFVEGMTLGQIIAESDISLREKLEIAKQIASALYEAHNAGIIHRDIKPENVIRRSDGLVKVLDFGLAKTKSSHNGQLVDSEGRTREQIITSPGMVMGTPHYMSPEQAAGKEVDHKTDIFSFGVLLFELISGKLPFQGENAMTTIASILHEDPAPLEKYVEDLPDGLAEISARCLKKDKESRYGDMGRMLEHLDAVIARTPAALEHPTITRGDEVRDTAKNSVQFWLVGHLVYVLVPVFVILAALAAFLIPYYFGSFKYASETEKGLTMKTVSITSWTSGPGELSPNASFSPDSKLIAFGAAKTGASQIWLKPTNGGREIRVTNDDFYNQFPVWSPGGDEIAYFSKRGDDGGIWRVSFTGGQPKQVVGDLEPSVKIGYWSDSGKIYFHEQFDLFAVEVASGKTEQVTDFESKGLKPRTIEISNDEKRVAYSIKEGGIWMIKVMKLQTGETSQIGTSGMQVDDISWHPDGSKVIYSGSVEGTYQVFESQIDSGRSARLSNGDFHHFVQDVSNDGSRVLYRSATEDSDIWQVDAETGVQKVVADGMNAEYWGEYSPGGEALVYQSVRHMFGVFGGSIEARSLSDGAVPIELAPSGFFPTWSPDGERVAFLKRTGKDIELWCVRRTGDNRKILSDGGIQPPAYSIAPYLKLGLNELSWSPDGKNLAYPAIRNGFSDIWIVSSDAKNNKNVSRNQNRSDYFCCPIWIGYDIVFSSREIRQEPVGERIHRIRSIDTENGTNRIIVESKNQILLLGSDANEKRLIYAFLPGSQASNTVPKEIRIFGIELGPNREKFLTSLTYAYFHNIHLSPDAKMLAYVSRQEGTSEIQIVPLSGGTPRILIVEKDPKIFLSSLSWAPDGKSLIFGKQSSTNLLSMLVGPNKMEDGND